MRKLLFLTPMDGLKKSIMPLDVINFFNFRGREGMWATKMGYHFWPHMPEILEHNHAVVGIGKWPTIFGPHCIQIVISIFHIYIKLWDDVVTSVHTNQSKKFIIDLIRASAKDICNTIVLNIIRYKFHRNNEYISNMQFCCRVT